MNPNSLDASIIHQSTSESDSRRASFVLQAAGIPHEIHQQENDWIILVPATHANQARAELEEYAAENSDAKPQSHAIRSSNRSWIGVVMYIAILILMTIFQKRNAFATNWTNLGEANSQLIHQGQWWRAITALTLHSSIEHLAGNLIIGGLVGLLAGQLLGSGVAWLAILIGGATGNLLNALIRPGLHISIGASTSVFAALGILAGLAWRRTHHSVPPHSPRMSSMQRWAPLISGAILLSFFGAGGEHTDVAAHIFGFLCGAALGAILARQSNLAWGSRQKQILCGLTAFIILVGAWTLAVLGKP